MKRVSPIQSSLPKRTFIDKFVQSTYKLVKTSATVKNKVFSIHFLFFMIVNSLKITNLQCKKIVFIYNCRVFMEVNINKSLISMTSK